MASIFLSYRRKDSEKVTRSICKELTSYYGEGFIFFDESSIPLAEDFRGTIRDALSECSVFIPIIGPAWTESIIASGMTGGTWQDPYDYVFLEVEEALSIDGLHILPVFLDGTPPPSSKDLPERLKELSFRNGFKLYSSSLEVGVQNLVRKRLDTLLTGSALTPLTDFCHQDDYEALRREHYRHEARYCHEINSGEVDEIGEVYLNALGEHLQLSAEVTGRIGEINAGTYSRYRKHVRAIIDKLVTSPRPSDLEKQDLESLIGRRAIVYLRRLHQNFKIPRYIALRLDQQVFEHWRDEALRKARMSIQKSRKGHLSIQKIDRPSR